MTPSQESVSGQAIVAELARMAALFQQRAIVAHLGFGPTLVHANPPVSK